MFRKHERVVISCWLSKNLSQARDWAKASEQEGRLRARPLALGHRRTDVPVRNPFGGWCNAVKRLFYKMKDKVRNKLSKRQHEDEASWSTRSWLSLQAQRMSVALQLAAADEIATELRLAAAPEDATV